MWGFLARSRGVHRRLRRLWAALHRVVQWDLSLTGASLDRVNIGYILLLGWVGLFLFLLHEYRRHKRFYGRLLEVPAAGALDAVGALSAPQSNEQRLIYEAWQSLSARLQSELAKEREQAAE